MHSQGGAAAQAPVPTPNAGAAAQVPVPTPNADAAAQVPVPTLSAGASALKSDPRTKYTGDEISNQLVEAIVLSIALLIAVGLTFYLWQFSASFWCLAVLSGLAGVIAGLLHSLKWFYRTVGDGEWEKDRAWWRYLNPLVSGVMGFSIYIVVRSGIDKTISTEQGKDALIAYSVGFLTGLFADNAMNKLRDIAHVLFGSAAPASSKPKSPASRSGHSGGHPPNA